MYLSNVIVLALTATLGASYTLPAARLADGLYLATYDAEGLTVTRRIGDLGSKPAEGLGHRDVEMSSHEESLEPRDQYATYHCGCGIGVNHANCDAAVGALENGLGNGYSIPSNTAYFAVASNVVAFICNHFASSATDTAKGFRSAASNITGRCGFYIAGTQSLLRSYDSGYMNYSPGLNFCANADTAAASSC